MESHQASKKNSKNPRKNTQYAPPMWMDIAIIFYSNPLEVFPP